MSLQLNNTTTKNGIIQRIESYCGFNDGDISGNTLRLAKTVGEVNVAHDEVLAKIFEVGGTWQFDDSNHTDYPIITTSLNSGQKDYSFTVDGNGNLILEIHKVYVKDSAGTYYEVYPVDVQSEKVQASFYDGLGTQGQPMFYDKTANGIFFDVTPNYTQAAGIKILISREGSYFTTSDTTKKPGIAGLYHDYYALKPSYNYCLRNKMFDLAERYKREAKEIMDGIQEHYKKREKDVVKRMTGAVNNIR